MKLIGNCNLLLWALRLWFVLHLRTACVCVCVRICMCMRVFCKSKSLFDIFFQNFFVYFLLSFFLLLSLERMRTLFCWYSFFVCVAFGFPFFPINVFFLSRNNNNNKNTKIHCIKACLDFFLQSICICLLCKVYLNIYYN